jgi:signal transduction histidine kinase/ActR/RegA family two-component response regulator
MPENRSDRVLILAPVGRDAHASAELLRKAGLNAGVCPNLQTLVGSLAGEDAAALFVAEEALFGRDLKLLHSWVDAQPAWSDLPIVVLTSHHQDQRVAAWRQELVQRLRNVSLLERPVHPITLTSTLQTAVRARRRQYEVRALLDARERSSADLQRKVVEATQELRQQMERQSRIEDALRQAQKMEAIGQLTGGVAHDFNNLLMVISAGLDILERERNGSAPDHNRFRLVIDSMRNTARRGSGLTRQLLAFARRHPLKPEPIDLARQLGGMQELLDRSLGGNIRLVMEFGPDLWPVEVDAGELELVVLNLAVNARDAMPGGGTITIRAKNVPAGSTERNGVTLHRDAVLLGASDTGLGMTAEVQARAFEPFFTTKEVGKGSGLGLAQAYGFAHGSGGQVWIDSQPGSGTSINMLLPRCHAEVTDDLVRPLQSQAPEDNAERGRHVLLVEDDKEVATLVSQMLVELGYRVTCAGSAHEALLELANGRSVDLVFSDIMMSGDMDGLGLAREIKLRHARLPVLLTSGYAESARQKIEASGLRLLAKPFGLDDLEAALRQSFQACSRA